VGSFEAAALVIGGLVLIGYSEVIRRRQRHVFGAAAIPRWRYLALVGGALFIVRGVLALVLER
jgi:hypothetical protein